MSQHPDEPAPDPAGSEIDPMTTSESRDLHPAVNPRAPLPASQPQAPIEAPPLDIDERDHAQTLDPPDVIALPEAENAPAQEVGSVPFATDREQVAPAEAGTQAVVPEPIPDSVSDASGDQPGPGPRETGVTAAQAHTTTSSRLGETASKLGLGRLLRTSDDGKPGAAGMNGSGDPVRDAAPGGAGTLGRLGDSFRTWLDPRLHVQTTIPHRRVLAASAVLILVALLVNSGGLALILLSAVVPVLIVVTLTQHDVFEKESNLLVTAVGLGGAVVGLVLSLLAAWIQSSQWFDNGVLNYGASGFGGRFADAAGSPPFVAWFLIGLVIPAVAVAGIAGVPIALRRWPQFRNEVMDGVILVGAAAAGFAIGASVVYWWPMVGDPGPAMDVRDWTLTIIGAGIVRSTIVTLCGAMIGAGIWRYMITPKASAVLLPAVGGVGGYLLLTFGSVQLQATSIWLEFLWVLLLAVAVFALYRRVLDAAVATDRVALGDDEGRLVCPSCHRVTPAGAFCARCGRPLPQPSHTGGATVAADEPETPDPVL